MKISLIFYSNSLQYIRIKINTNAFKHGLMCILATNNSKNANIFYIASLCTNLETYLFLINLKTVLFTKQQFFLIKGLIIWHG